MRPNVVHISAGSCRAPLGQCDCGAELEWLKEQSRRVWTEPLSRIELEPDRFGRAVRYALSEGWCPDDGAQIVRSQAIETMALDERFACPVCGRVATVSGDEVRAGRTLEVLEHLWRSF